MADIVRIIANASSLLVGVMTAKRAVQNGRQRPAHVIDSAPPPLISVPPFATRIVGALPSRRVTRSRRRPPPGPPRARVRSLAPPPPRSPQLALALVRARVLAADDATVVTLPPNPMLRKLAELGATKTQLPLPTLLDSMGTSRTTTKEYDLARAKKLRVSYVFPALVVAFLHLKRGQLQAPLLGAAMGLKALLLDEPLVQVGPLSWKGGRSDDDDEKATESCGCDG